VKEELPNKGMNQSERVANGVKRSAGYGWCWADLDEDARQEAE
jgi:hypothetical protein